MLLLCAGASLAAQKQPPPKPLDLNTATVEQLQQLPGVGPVTAQAIVDFRTKSGPFRRVEDLLAIRGITDRRLRELRPYVTVVPIKKASLYAPHRAILGAPLQGGDTDNTTGFWAPL
jgi:competence ComEA-like helix-hairpin-helix protein